jgi:hypothetical protein
MRRLLSALILAGALALATAASAGAEAVPAGCEGGAWSLSYVGVEGHRWYNPLYPMTSAENFYGAGHKYDPCYPIGSTANSYGAGYNGVATP